MIRPTPLEYADWLTLAFVRNLVLAIALVVGLSAALAWLACWLNDRRRPPLDKVNDWSARRARR